MQEYISFRRCSWRKPRAPRRLPGGFRMAKNDLVFRIGGAAGDGVSSTAESFAKMSARSGLHTWTYSSYQSVIRGGPVWTQIRGSLGPVLSHGVDPDVVVALDPPSLDADQGDVGGAAR